MSEILTAGEAEIILSMLKEMGKDFPSGSWRLNRYIKALRASLAAKDGEIGRLKEELSKEDPIYCVNCGSCGVVGCCRELRCKYVDEHHTAISDNNEGLKELLADCQRKLKDAREALKEARAWMVHGTRETPAQRGAKCETSYGAHALVDAALSDEPKEPKP